MKLKQFEAGKESNHEHCWHAHRGLIWMVIPDGHVLQNCCKCGASRMIHADHAYGYHAPGESVRWFKEHAMTTNDLKHLLTDTKSIEWLYDEQDLSSGIRLFISDPVTGECGVLAIEPIMLALPDEAALEFSYQSISDEWREPEVGYDVLTRVGPDYDRGEVPFLQ